MSPAVQTLSEKIESLSAEQFNEVSDFVEFLRTRAQDRELTRAAMLLNEPLLAAIWDNSEDDVYDAL